MDWFTGSVTEALSNYQDKNGILIVYIHHTAEAANANTKKFNELWDLFDKSILNEVPFVAIRLTSDSEDTAQFSQFFPAPIFPVCYVIGLNGQPLEVITPAEDLSVSRLNESLTKSIKLYRDQLKEKSVKSTDEQNTVSQPQVSLADNSNSSSTGAENISLDERIRYARERLEEKRKADAINQENEKRRKELERRNEGKHMLDAREKQKERELKEALDKRKREKEADQQALKRLREEIKKDKEERAKAANPAAQEETTVKTTPVTEKPACIDESKECRIQCRFSDGKTFVRTFTATDTLQAVVDAVKQNGQQLGEFFLVQMYPRRQLNELDKTLIDLHLTPSCSLLVVPKEEKKSHRKSLLQSGTNTTYFQLLFSFLYLPIMVILNFIGIGRSAVASNAVPGTSSKKNEQEAATTSKGKESTRREGHIGRLRDDDENSSDNEGTWNGNSTQQL